MPDFFDRAQDHEARLRQQHIDRALASLPIGPGPLLIDGHTCCAECEEPIAQERLAALPGVGLCVICARLAEKQS